MVKLLIDVIAEKCRNETSRLYQSINDIKTKIKARPEHIEGLTS